MQSGARRQRVFITGASSGLGSALARHYAAQGAIVGLLARRELQLREVLHSLPNAQQHLVYAADVNDHAALAGAAADFIRHAGGIDIVIASAGISRGTLTEHAEDLAVFEHIFATNVVAMAATFAPFIATMKAQAQAGEHGCRLVGFSSVAGVRGLPGGGAYSGSKSAVRIYCESLRLELKKDGIKVVTLAPGYVDTAMTRVNQYAMPFLMPAEKFAHVAARAIAAGASFKVIPWQMGWVAKLLRLLPNWLYDRLFVNAPRKTRDPY